MTGAGIVGLPMRVTCVIHGRELSKPETGNRKELFSHLYNGEEMLGTRSRNVAVCSLLIVVWREHLYDHDRIRLEPFEARPRGDEHALALTPRVEVLGDRHSF